MTNESAANQLQLQSPNTVSHFSKELKAYARIADAVQSSECINLQVYHTLVLNITDRVAGIGVIRQEHAKSAAYTVSMVAVSSVTCV